MTYETKKQRERKDKAKAKADHLHAAASHQLAHADDSVKHIPMGQPILVGHYSEKRHRKDVATAQRKTRQALETYRQAEKAEWRARNAGRAITSDDPEAIIALESKLADLEAKRDFAKAVNKAWRKNGEEGLKALDLSEALVESLVQTMKCCPWFSGPYQTTNINAEIRRVKARIQQLKEAAERPEAAPIEGKGFRIEEDKNDCRIRFYFDERPDRETCRRMRQAGFKFSRQYTAWQRMLNNGGRYAAERMAKELFNYKPDETDE